MRCPNVQQAFISTRKRIRPEFLIARLQPGDVLRGPAVVYEAMSTTVIDPGWKGEILSRGDLLLSDVGTADRVRRALPVQAKNDNGTGGASGTRLRVPGVERSEPPASAVPKAADDTATRHAPMSGAQPDCDPATLEVFNNRFAAIAEQMGITLRNTASSVNVKERLDFSCALFTSAGDLVVNAPHIPVHLGAMGETVRSVLADNPTIQPGDVLVTNDPYRGGSHLPDVTVVTPIFDTGGGRLLFFTASRAHHAEIGGIVPGSMPPFSQSLAEEGVLVGNFKLVDAGHSRVEEFRSLLLAGPYPTRKVADNLADVAAQVAANQQGARDLARLIERHTLAVVEAYMSYIQQAAERKMRDALAPAARPAYVRRPFGRRLGNRRRDRYRGRNSDDRFHGHRCGARGQFERQLRHRHGGRDVRAAAIDRRGYSIESRRACAGHDRAARMSFESHARSDSRGKPGRGRRQRRDFAARGGRALGALAIAAASQGTMNNLLFGDSTFGYYETICGGSGATLAADGADAVHTHMTNTRLTDPEVLEQRYPVRLVEFSIRRGSGGAGRHRGGNGVRRRIEFLRRLDVSILSQRRGPYPPYGLAGGEPGALGRNALTPRMVRTRFCPARRTSSPSRAMC